MLGDKGKTFDQVLMSLIGDKVGDHDANYRVIFQIERATRLAPVHAGRDIDTVIDEAQLGLRHAFGAEFLDHSARIPGHGVHTAMQETLDPRDRRPIRW